jgi:tetratricopeptide (TPR) repeat protein
VAEAERLKQRGNVKYNGEEYITAIKLYTRAIKLVPANPTYLLNRAAALIMMERYDDGEFVFFSSCYQWSYFKYRLIRIFFHFFRYFFFHKYFF